MGKNVIVVGTQWGDEGKGKIVDWLSESVHSVVRFQGGHNAGHTLYINKKKIILRLIPSGIMHNDVICLIGNGVVLSLENLFQEIRELESIGLNIQCRLQISEICPLLLPYHVVIDQAREKQKDKNKIGTTGRGIGPVYEDKIARRALRVQDLFFPKIFSEKLLEALDYHNFILTNLFKINPISPIEIEDNMMAFAPKIAPMVRDVSKSLIMFEESGYNCLFEGAQGSLLDIDHGTYPYVTSSNCVAGTASVGTGIGPKYFNYVLGVTKAYTTRVGSGPFPTELIGTEGKLLATLGKEIGSVTGRNRRCGWLDIAALKRSIILNSISALCITKLDVLDHFKTIQLCIGYRLHGKFYDILPSGTNLTEQIEPVFEEIPGWFESISGIKKLELLPIKARYYLERITEICGIPIDIISTGPDRNETIIVRHPFKK